MAETLLKTFIKKTKKVLKDEEEPQSEIPKSASVTMVNNAVVETSLVKTNSHSLINGGQKTKSPTVPKKSYTLRAKSKPKNIGSNESAGDYILMELIGKGAYGSVFKGLHKDKGSFVAIKKVNIGIEATEEHINSFKMEIQLLQRLKHPKIVKYIDHVQADSCLYIVMEFMEIGSLSQIIKKHGVFFEALVDVYIAQVLSGLEYLHKQGVIHRDIKAENLLISTDGSVKLADFGIATHLNDLKDEEALGTPYWMAPEIISMQAATTSCDIWSLGCTIIELLTGAPPYFDLQPVQAIYKIVNDEIPPLPEGISEKLRDFLTRCFQKNESLRVNAVTLRNHPWIKNVQKEGDISVQNVATKLSEYNQRIGEEAKQSAFPTVRMRRLRQNRSRTISYREELSDLLQEVQQNKKRTSRNLGQVFPLTDDSVSSNNNSSNNLNNNDTLNTSLSLTNSKDQTSSIIRESRLSKYTEKDESFLDGFTDLDKNKLILKPKDTKEWDPEIEETFEVETREDEAMKEKYSDMVQKDIKVLIQQLDQTSDPQQLIEVCNQLEQIFKHNSNEKMILITHHGILALFDQLSKPQQEPVILSILELINSLITYKPIRDGICLLGGIPIVISLITKLYSSSIRLSIGQFIRYICSSPNTMQMFLSCRGFDVLTALLDSNFNENRDLNLVCLDSILDILKLEVNTEILDDFVMLLHKTGLLKKLALGLSNINSTILDTHLQNYFFKLSKIFQIFSQSDSVIIKEEMCSMEILMRMRNVFQVLLPHKHLDLTKLLRGCLINLLKVIKNLAIPSNRDSLERCGFLEVLSNLVQIKQTEIRELKNLALNSLIMMSQFDRNRQEKMALSGIIPALHEIIKSEESPSKLISNNNSSVITRNNSSIKVNEQAASSPLREKALSIFFDILHGSPETRKILWDNNSLKVYLELLVDEHWYVNSMDAISAWVGYEPVKLEEELCKDENVLYFRKVFEKNSLPSFPKILQPFLNIVTSLIRFNKKLSNLSLEFIPLVLESLQILPDSLSTVQILKILNCLFTNSDNRLEMFMTYKLFPVIKDIADDANRGIIVSQMANQLLQNFIQLSKRTI